MACDSSWRPITQQTLEDAAFISGQNAYKRGEGRFPPNDMGAVYAAKWDSGWIAEYSADWAN